MKRMRISLLFTTALLSYGLKVCATAAPYFSTRSQGFDSARSLVGWTREHYMHRHDQDNQEFYHSFSLLSEYTQSFKADRIGRCLFGEDIVECDCAGAQIKIQGSSVTNRNSKAWLADYFGLPVDFDGSFVVAPKIRNAIVDFNWYVGLDPWIRGTYFMLQLPFAHSRWKLDYSEQIANPGSARHPAGYFDSAATDAISDNPRSNLLDSFEDFISGEIAPTLNGDVVFKKLNCSKFATKQCSKHSTLKKSKLASVNAVLGWNFFRGLDYHIGANVRVSAPTGNHPDGEFLFEAVVGNGGHWEFGFGVDAHRAFWKNDDESQHMSCYVVANITHLFSTRQKRSFDLKNCDNSRYMLAARFDENIENLFGRGTTPGGPSVTNDIQPIAQFANVYQPAANLTCCDVDVSVGIQADVTASINYTNGNFGWDLGYNFWGKTCEKIRRICQCPCPLEDVERNKWVLKGDAHMFGYGATDSTTPGSRDLPIQLSASNSRATIRSGTNKTVATETDRIRNTQIDHSRQFAVSLNQIGGPLDRIMTQPSLNAGDDDQQGTSVDPIFLTLDNVDFESGRIKGLSHKLFTHVYYGWQYSEKYNVHFGIGAKVEFAQGNSSKASPTACSTFNVCEQPKSCKPCVRCSVTEWGLWLKGGVTFN